MALGPCGDPAGTCNRGRLPIPPSLPHVCRLQQARRDSREPGPSPRRTHHPPACLAAQLTACDCPEAFLACRVPYLEFHPLPIDEHLFDLKVNPAGGPLQGRWVSKSWRRQARGPGSSAGCQGSRGPRPPNNAPYCGNETGSKRVLREAQQQAALANTCENRDGADRVVGCAACCSSRPSRHSHARSSVSSGAPLSPISRSLMR